MSKRSFSRIRVMLIGIDGNEANIENRVGVNQYAYEVIRHLEKLETKHKFLIYLKKPPLAGLPKEREGWKYKVLPGRGLWIITRLTPELFLGKPRPNVIFSPSHYVPPISPMPKVCSIMDLGYLEFSGHLRKYDFWQLKLWTAWSIFVSKYIITISETSKKDIVRHYSFASPKVKVTLLGYDKTLFNTKVDQKEGLRIREKYGIAGDYVLFLSTLKPSKNVEGLIRAWGRVYQEFPNFTLVIAGKKGWLYQSIFNLVKELKLSGNIIFTDFIPEEDKPALISGATLFVLPSFWEGFGLDVLCAQACGVATVVSNKGSLPEVAGGASITIDPYNTESLEDAIKKVLSFSDIEYNRYINKGLVNARRFSWEKGSEATLKILESSFS